LDGYVIALDAVTARSSGSSSTPLSDKGETITPAPIIANDKVIIGFGGDEFAARGRVTAYNLADARRCGSVIPTGSDADVCMTKNTNKKHPEYGQFGKDLGLHTFPGDEWKRGGGAAWGCMPTTRRCTWCTTGRATRVSGLRSIVALTADAGELQQRQVRQQVVMSIFARNVDTGEAEWIYQMTPFDQWDYDGVNEVVLVDLNVDGQMRKALVHFDRNGFAYVLDRTDGTLLRAHKYVTTNWAEKSRYEDRAARQGARAFALKAGVNTQACPSAMGGKDQQPVAVASHRSRQFLMCRRITGAWKMNLRSARTPSRELFTCSPTCTCILKNRASPASSRSQRG